MYRHKEEILKGCLKPDNLSEADHIFDPTTKSGYLQDQILQLSSEIPRKVYNHVPFKNIAVDFGRLSHYVADLNDPLLLGNSDTRESQYQSDFAIYLERNIDLFPWIFDGHLHPLLAKGNEKEFVAAVAANAVERYPLIGDAYFPDGVLVSSSTFDPKSLPFGIASLSYTRSISNTVQIWFYTWQKSHGDTTWTPFHSKGKKKKKKE